MVSTVDKDVLKIPKHFQKNVLVGAETCNRGGSRTQSNIYDGDFL